MFQTDTLRSLRDDLATTESRLDRDQADIDAHRHEWHPDIAWSIQARIDRERFELATKKMLVDALSAV